MKVHFNITSIVLTLLVTQFIVCYVIMPFFFNDMCISPIPIKNPYKRSVLLIKQHHDIYGRSTDKVLSTLKDDPLLNLHDSTSSYMLVPCGHCKDCLRARRYNLVQRCEMESLNCYPFFITLTYDNEHLPHYLAGNGKTYTYANREYVKNMFKRIRTNSSIPRPFRYIAVSERGSLHSRPHHHILLFLPKDDNDDYFTPFQLEELLYNLFFNEWKVNLSDDPFNPIYEPLFTFKQRVRNGVLNSTYDCHYIRPFIDDVTRNVTQYIFKYIAKPQFYEQKIFKALKNDSPTFTHDWRIIRSCFTASRFWGTQSVDEIHLKPSPAVLNHIRSCVENYHTGFPQYFSPFSTDVSSLSPYYITKDVFFKESDKLKYIDFLRSKGYYKFTDLTHDKEDMYNPNNVDNDILQWNLLTRYHNFDKLDFSFNPD